MDPRMGQVSAIQRFSDHHSMWWVGSPDEGGFSRMLQTRVDLTCATSDVIIFIDSDRSYLLHVHVEVQ